MLLLTVFLTPLSLPNRRQMVLFPCAYTDFTTIIKFTLPQFIDVVCAIDRPLFWSVECDDMAISNELMEFLM